VPTSWEVVFSPAWSPDGAVIAYAACETFSACGVPETRLSDGADTVLIAPAEGHLPWPTSWSPDGRYLIFGRTASFDPNGAEFWTYDRASGESAPLFSTPSRFSALEGAVSPDGRWLAYRSEETGAWEVWVRPFQSAGAPRRISAEGGRLPRRRADGRELFFQWPDGQIMSVEVQAGPEFTHSPPLRLFGAPAGSRHNLFDIGTSYDVSPDGQRFAVRMTATVPHAALVQNWRALVR